MVQGCLSLVVVGKQGFTGLQGQEGQGRRPLQATQWLFMKGIFDPYVLQVYCDLLTKGQLISKSLFGVIVSTKKQRKYCKDFCPESFYSFLGASWKLFEASLLMILLTESPGSPPGSYKKFQGRNPYNIFVTILVKTMKTKRHFEINWPLGIYIHIED